MPTKHEMIIQFIDSLSVGEKVSVRSIAKNMKISEGTAYRAIKESEKLGLVSTIDRVGTIRVERKTKRNFEHLTFEAIEKIIDGTVLGGKDGLQRQLNKFVIGAMQEDAMLRYITPNSLMIVGNRTSVQQLALESGAAVLITGGFETTNEIIDLANEMHMPLISTSYDSFTVATMINRAMSDQLIKKEIILVENVYTPLTKTNYLKFDDTVLSYKELSQMSDHARFPVINSQGRLVGIVTSKDIMKKSDDLAIEKVMTKTPFVTKVHTSIASVSHMMIWEGLDIVPVVNDAMQLLGIISRSDVMKAIQLSQRQPQVADTIKDQITSNLEEVSNDGKYLTKEFQMIVEPQMLNSVGTIAYGVLAQLITESAQQTLYNLYKQGAILEQFQMHYFKMIQNDSQLMFKCYILDNSRRITKVEVSVFSDSLLMAKAIVSYHIIQHG